DRASAHGERARRAGARRWPLGPVELGVELGEPCAIGAARKRIGAGRRRPALEARQALERVLRPADALAEFTVARDVDAHVGLPLHDLLHRMREAALVSR